MKKLILIRHGKSDWSIDGQPDIDRPLNPRGYSDAHKMAAEFFSNHGAPHGMVSSSAIRALSTALIFAGETGFPKSSLVIEPSLYESDAEEYLNVVHRLDNNLNSVALFGHNPSVADFYTLFTNQFTDIPTCAILVFEMPAEKWTEVSPKNTKFIELKQPKKSTM